MKYSIIYIVILAFIALSCNNAKKNKAQKPEAIPIQIAIAKTQSYDTELELSGTFYANKEANLGAAMPGKIEKFHFPEGTFVKKGDLLVELSAEMLTQAMIEHDALQKDFDRVERLFKKGSVAEIEYDHLKAKLEASATKTEMIRKNTTIIAPFDGILVEYLVEEGENYFFNINLEPGYSHTSGILRLMQLNPLKVSIEINEKNLNSVHEGDQVRVLCDAYPDQEYNGVITYIKPILSTVTRTATAEITISNSNLQIKPGMFARVYIPQTAQTATCVPLDAIYRQPGTPEDYVYKITSDTAQRIRINRLKNLNAWVAVDSINEGDTVATQGKNRLVSGMQVKIIDKP